MGVSTFIGSCISNPGFTTKGKIVGLWLFSKLKSAPSLTEDQVDSGLKEIRQALIEADVALPVAKDFIANIKPKAIGQEIIRSTSPGQMIVKMFTTN